MRSWIAVGLVAVLLAVGTGMGCEPEEPDPGAFEASLRHRKRALEYLRFATEQQSKTSILNAIAHMERDRIDVTYDAPAGIIGPDDWQRTWDKLEALQDTRDFDGLYLLNALLGYEGHPYLAPETWERIRTSLLSFKMWYTDPTPAVPDASDPDRFWDNSFYWTENHQILFHTIEYLAGQRFPDACFWIHRLTEGPSPDCSGPGQMTGSEHMERVRPKILAWLDDRWEAGFSEWHSNIYLQKDATPLLTLAEYAEDPEIATRASIVLDILLLDMAAVIHKNVLGVTHGRSAMKDKYRGPTNDTWGISVLIFGQQSDIGHVSRGEPGATLFSRARKYRVPRVVIEAANEPGPFVNRTRQSFFLDERGPLVEDPPHPPGKGFELTEENFTFWWGLGAYTVWQVVPLTVTTGDQYDLWETELLSDFRALRDILGDPGEEPNLLFGQGIAAGVWPLIAVGFLKEANTYTYRTPDYVLSTALDYRKGANAGQVHAWQATFDEETSVFTTHPMNDVQPPSEWVGRDEGEPGYWSGSASLPRSAQVENVALHIYSPLYPKGGLFGFFDYQSKTHAWFPQDRFDEVEQVGGWTFGRKGDGYIALYSFKPTSWQPYAPEELALLGGPPMTQSFDLVAEDQANVWIVECGRKADWGSFAAFRDAVLGANIEITTNPSEGGIGHPSFDVLYESPSQGTLELPWEGAFTVNGQDVPLGGQPRVSNPWVHAERGDPVWNVAGDHGTWVYDWTEGTRRFEAGP